MSSNDSTPDPTPGPLDTPLAHLARRAAADPWFLAAALAGYQDRHALDDAALAAELGCAVAVLPSLALCRMPGRAEPQRTAAEDINDICRRFGVSADALRRVVEEAGARP